jgi:hypothetical protein
MSFAEGGTEVRSYIRIHYTSDTCADYCKGLTAAKTLEALQNHVQTYQRVADDAWKVVKDMGQPAFLSFLNGLRRERRGHFAGEEWAEKYGAVLMPEILMRVSMVANMFGAPWGCAYLQLRAAEKIVERDNVARWNDPPAEAVS